MKSDFRFVSLFVLAGLIGGPLPTVSAQVKYELLHDDPGTFKNLFIDIKLLNLDLASPTEWRPAIGAEFTLSKQLYFFGEYGRNLFSTAPEEAKNKSQTYIEAGGIYSFKTAIKKEARVKVSAHGGGPHSRLHFKLKARAQKQWGIHAGVNEFSTYNLYKGYVAYTSTSSVFGGIALTTTRDLLVSLKDYGTYNRPSRSIWYVDVLFAPSVQCTDATDYVVLAGSASTATPAGFPSITKLPIGARMGYMKYKNWPLPLREGIEFGMRPGIGSGLFVALKVDVALGFAVGGGRHSSGKSDDKK